MFELQVVGAAVVVQRVSVQCAGDGSSGQEIEEFMDRGFGSGRELSDQE